MWIFWVVILILADVYEKQGVRNDIIRTTVKVRHRQ